jgi:hypothetical protein
LTALEAQLVGRSSAVGLGVAGVGRGVPRVGVRLVERKSEVAARHDGESDRRTAEGEKWSAKPETQGRHCRPFLNVRQSSEDAADVVVARESASVVGVLV